MYFHNDNIFESSLVYGISKHRFVFVLSNLVGRSTCTYCSLFFMISSYLSPYFSRLRFSRAALRFSLCRRYASFSSSVILDRSTLSSVVASLKSSGTWEAILSSVSPGLWKKLTHLSRVFPHIPYTNNDYVWVTRNFMIK